MTDIDDIKTEHLIDELAGRIQRHKRAIDARLSREAELRVALMNERSQRDGAEGRRDLLAVEVTLEKTRAKSAEARVEELTTENARLEQEAQFAEMRKSPAEQEIKILRAENERLREQVDEWIEEHDRERWRVQTLRADLASLRAENERLKKSCGRMSDWVKSLRSENDRLRTAVPRVIRPDEWKAGQVVAARPGARQHRPDAQDRWTITTVGEQPHGEWRFIWMDLLYVPSTDAEDVTVVLLADATEEADDPPCCRIKQTGICEDIG